MKPKKLQKKLIFNKFTVANLNNTEKGRVLGGGGDQTPEYICPETMVTCAQQATCNQEISCITCPAAGCGGGNTNDPTCGAGCKTITL